MDINAKIENYNNYTLCEVIDDKFKTNHLVFSYKYKADRKNFIYFYLLSGILFTTSKKYNTKRKYNNKNMDIYSPKVLSNLSVSGKYIIFRAKVSFLKEKYTEKGMDKKAVKFFLDSFFNPLVENGEFDKEIFKTRINQIVDYIKDIKDNPDIYAFEKLKKEFNRESSFCYTLLNTEDEFKSITSKDLYEFYKKMINEGNLIVSFLGNVDFNYKKMIDKCLENRNNQEFKESHLENLKVNDKVNVIKETLSTKQSRLKMIYIYDTLTDFENKYVIRVLDFILGGSSDSLLFKEVREKHSLCYKIYSSSSMVNNMMIIDAGIDASNYDKTLKLIEEQVEFIKKGKFDESYIENAKNSYKIACVESLDSPSSIVSSYLGYLYGTLDLLDERIENMGKVKKKDVIKLANKLHLDTIYFLEGDE